MRGGSRGNRDALFATGQSEVARILFASHVHHAIERLDKAVTPYTVGRDQLTIIAGHERKRDELFNAEDAENGR